MNVSLSVSPWGLLPFSFQKETQNLYQGLSASWPFPCRCWFGDAPCLWPQYPTWTRAWAMAPHGATRRMLVTSTTTAAFSLISAPLMQGSHPGSCKGWPVTCVHSSFAPCTTAVAHLFCPHAAWCELTSAWCIF